MREVSRLRNLTLAEAEAAGQYAAATERPGCGFIVTLTRRNTAAPTSWCPYRLVPRPGKPATRSGDEVALRRYWSACPPLVKPERPCSASFGTCLRPAGGSVGKKGQESCGAAFELP